MSARDTRIRDLSDIRTRFLMDLVVDLDPHLDIGRVPTGRRILFGAAGGSFSGDRLDGVVLPGGGDWALFRKSREMSLDVRLTLRANKGALISVSYGGRWINPADIAADMAHPDRRTVIDPERYYFRTSPVFETGSEELGWLNEIVCIGKGYPVPGGVAYRIYEVL